MNVYNNLSALINIIILWILSYKHLAYENTDSQLIVQPFEVAYRVTSVTDKTISTQLIQLQLSSENKC